MPTEDSLYYMSTHPSNPSLSRWSSDVATTVEDTSQHPDTTTASSYSTTSARQVLGRASIDARRKSPLTLADCQRAKIKTMRNVGKEAHTRSSFHPSLAAGFFEKHSLEQACSFMHTTTSPSTDSFATTFDHRPSMQSERGREGEMNAAHVREHIKQIRTRRPSTIKEQRTPVKRHHLKSRFSVSPRRQKPLPAISSYKEVRQQRKTVSPNAVAKRKAPSALHASPLQSIDGDIDRPLPRPPTGRTLQPQKSFASIRLTLSGRGDKFSSSAPAEDEFYQHTGGLRSRKAEVRFPGPCLLPRTSTDFLRAKEAEKRSTFLERGSWIDVHKEPKSLTSMSNGRSWWSRLRSRQKSLFSKKASKQGNELRKDETGEQGSKTPNIKTTISHPIVLKEPDHTEISQSFMLPLRTSSRLGSMPPPQVLLDESRLSIDDSSVARSNLRPLRLNNGGVERENEKPIKIASNNQESQGQKSRPARIKSRNLSLTLPYLTHCQASSERDCRDTAVDQNVTQKTISSSILDLDEDLEPKKSSTHLSSQISPLVQFPTLTPNRATDALLDLVRQYKSDTSLTMLSPARVSSTWEMPCQAAAVLHDELMCHLSPTTRRTRRTTCTTMETIMTYQSSIDSSLGGSQAFRASWCTHASGDERIDVASSRHAIFDGKDSARRDVSGATTLSIHGEPSGVEDQETMLGSEESVVEWDEHIDAVSADRHNRDTLLEYKGTTFQSPKHHETVAPDGSQRHSRGITVARMMLPDTSRAVMKTIREYSAGYVQKKSLTQQRNAGMSSPRSRPSPRRPVRFPPTIRINRPESDSTMSRSSACPSDTTSTIGEAEVQRACVARKSCASVVDFAVLANVGALQSGRRRKSSALNRTLPPTSVLPWPVRSRNTSTSSVNSPASQILSDMPSFAWSANRTSSIGTSYTIPSPCRTLKLTTTARRPRLPSSSMVLSQSRIVGKPTSTSVALDTMQHSQDEHPDSEYTLGIMKLFQAPKTLEQTKAFLCESERGFTPLAFENPSAAPINGDERDLRLFSPTRQQGDRGHWRRFCLEQYSPKTNLKSTFGFGDKTFGVSVTHADDSGSVSMHNVEEGGSDEEPDACINESSVLYPSSLSTFLSLPTQSSPIKRTQHTRATETGSLSRMSSFRSDTSATSSSISWSPVARFLPFTSTSSMSPAELHDEDRKEQLQESTEQQKRAALKIVVQSPTTDGCGTPL